jgi:hypothetical protein
MQLAVIIQPPLLKLPPGIVAKPPSGSSAAPLSLSSPSAASYRIIEETIMSQARLLPAFSISCCTLDNSMNNQTLYV